MLTVIAACIRIMSINPTFKHRLNMLSKSERVRACLRTKKFSAIIFMLMF